MHGCAADMSALLDVARRHDLTLVEDAAQAHGAKVGDRCVGAIGASGGFSLQSSKNLSAGEGGLFVTNDDGMAEEALSVANFGQDLARSEGSHFDASRPLDGTRSLDSRRLGSMYRGNEMMAAFGRAQLARLRERTERCQRNADRLSKALSDLPGVTPPRVPAGRTSVHHKFRVHLDPERAGLELSPRQLRDGMLRALRAEGLEVVLWQSDPLPAQPVFHGAGYGRGFPWSGADGERARAGYDAARFPSTRRLLDGSIVVFSQSCPLIAQDAAMVDRYVEAFAKVWAQRASLFGR
jgi:dTDP-4-amino-4,6-dideoxygalactose transaminase